jgi:Dolichyl-phosphate-mannose-protein mannosyltransferase
LIRFAGKGTTPRESHALIYPNSGVSSLFGSEMNGMEIRINHTGNPALIVVILASLTAAGTAWWCMASGVGVSPDSVVYLSAADSVLAGQGLKSIVHHFTPTFPSRQPLVGFPPTYPLLLSLSGTLSTDRLNSARWLHSILFAVNTLLLGMIVYLATGRSALATLCATLLFLLSLPVLEIHTMAWSEAPFIMFLLLAALLLLLHINGQHYLLLIAAALSASLALTARYAGVTMLPPMVMTILLLKNRPLRNRIRDSVILVTIAVVPLAVWLLRNLMVAHSTTSRTIGFHPIGISEISNMANALLVFWLPDTGNTYLKIGLLFLCCVLVVAGIVLPLKDAVKRDQGRKMNSETQLFAAIFIMTYVLFLVAHNSLVNPVAVFESRTVAPACVFGIILIISVVYGLSRFGNRPALWWGFLALLFPLASGNAVRATSFVIQRHDNAIGYTSREWARSETIAYLRTLSDGRTIYSNGIDAIYFLTGRDALRIPAKFDPITGKHNADFERNISALRIELLQNRSVVVHFANIPRRWYLPSKDELDNYKLPVLIQLDDGVIYGIR